jgi:ATP-dependent helicase HrpB
VSHPPVPFLPVLAARDAIVRAVEKTGALILSAPPGTGKSTQVPQFLMKGNAREHGQLLVLQPRRIAARALAARIAEEIGDPLGKTVGYQVRFESQAGPDTQILFQTYGMFRQRLMRDPELRGVHTVILDEFHERAWEADLALAWLRDLRSRPAGKGRPDLRLVVMSATLDETGLGGYLPDAETVKVEGRAFPVEIFHQPPRLNELLPQQVLRAVKDVNARQSGSILVFLPGGGEIKWCGDALAAWCREAKYKLCELHGSMPLEAQQATLRAPERELTVILATNVAETSLTVPGVTAVIDAGLHRVAAYDAERDLNTLYLQVIARANAVQRSGRAGRVAPGIAIRLWDTLRESVMADHLEPEIRRVELSEPALAWHALRSEGGEARLQWPTPPEAPRWNRAEAKLARIGAITRAEGDITPLGRSLLGWPASPELARVLHDAARSPGGRSDSGLKRQVAAMAAALSAGKRGGGGSGKNLSDLFQLGEDLAAEPKTADREMLGAFRQFLGLLDKSRDERNNPESTRSSLAVDDLRAAATKLFLPVYVDRLAAREGSGAFILADGRKAVSTAPALTKLVLALEIHETGGKDRAKQTTLPLVLPVDPDWVREVFPGDCVWETAEAFDEKKGQLRKEERLIFRPGEHGGIILDRREKAVARNADASEVLIEKLRSGEITLPFDEEAWQWLYRIQLAHRACPESGMPEMNEDDWDLIYHEVCAGKKSLKQLQDIKVWVALRDYLGPALTAFLEREAPTSLKLPGPKRGKITYFEKAPPEVSARLGDFVGMQGRCKILMGRVDVTYDILAPNYRTVQKTSDLSSFWTGSYAEIRKELKRRYPKHPWPEF